MSVDRDGPDVDGYLNEVCWAMGGSFAEQQALRDELRGLIQAAGGSAADLTATQKIYHDARQRFGVETPTDPGYFQIAYHTEAVSSDADRQSRLQLESWQTARNMGEVY